MTRSERVLVVSDRAPLAFSAGPRGLRTTRGSGGVVTAVKHLSRSGPLTWVAPAVVEADLLAASRQREHGLLGKGDLALRLVPIERELYAGHRSGFADRVLWFIQHGMWQRRISPETPDRLRELFHCHAQVAARFGEAIASELHRPGSSSRVLIHDYQLYLAAQAVRVRVPGAQIAHFTHIPWPDPATWRAALPEDVLVRLLRGMLTADALLFQTHSCVSSFLSCVRGVLPDAEVSGDRVVAAGRRTLVRARPVSIDPAALRPSRAEVARLRADPRLLISRVDRADPMKNIPAGFAAFERMLEAHAELVGRVRFRARAVPTRAGVPEYAREQAEIRSAAARVNARFGEGTVELIERSDRARALADLAAADVVLVNSIADGMNLVAKEAVVVGDAALVLSKRAGAYEELREGALAIDPSDIEGTADALHRATAMSEPERKERAAKMRTRVRAWTSRDWLRAQLSDLEEATPPLAPALQPTVA